MSDLIIFDPASLQQVSQHISSQTEALKRQTPSLLDQIDAVSQQLPQPLYDQAFWQIKRIQAFLDRSMEIRDRLSTFLQLAAKAAEQLDQEMAQTFGDHPTSG
ncbi:hypothetical protein [Thermogemmatispora sp.]|uniref:hypothetical protein n=1 Tax=Thermogemmatispora sp. TaxID=1968838 RepID=UPI0035E42F93